jgi:4-hydroxy-3-methylbut-2-en-1-yl diphosphate reductase
MAAVQAQVEKHYRSSLVEQIRSSGNIVRVGHTTLQLAREFGFCYGVERAIDLAYAARKMFPTERFFLVGEIIHNPLVNEHIAALGISNLLDENGRPAVEILEAEDVVIIPAFGTEIGLLEQIKSRGCHIVDTTCGDVMSVWKRVRQNAQEQVTSIIHGKATHEETRATASRSLGDGTGHYLVVFDLPEAQFVADYLDGRGNRAEFLTKFAGKHSPQFDPDVHLERIGVANQTTMFKEETEAIQHLLREAVLQRDGSAANFRRFDTICAATQNRQDALKDLLRSPLDMLMVIGGYNSSNTTHLAEIGSTSIPTWFVSRADCLESVDRIRQFDLATRKESTHEGRWLPDTYLRIGLTAGASCPNNIIEDVVRRILYLRGAVLGADDETSTKL